MQKQLLLLCGMLATIGVLFACISAGTALESPPATAVPVVSVRLVPETQMPPSEYAIPKFKPATDYVCLTLRMGKYGGLSLYDTPWTELTDEGLRAQLRWKASFVEEKNGRYVWFPFERGGEKELSVRGLATALTRLRMYADPGTPTVIALHLYSLNKRKP